MHQCCDLAGLHLCFWCRSPTRHPKSWVMDVYKASFYKCWVLPNNISDSSFEIRDELLIEDILFLKKYSVSSLSHSLTLFFNKKEQDNCYGPLHQDKKLQTDPSQQGKNKWHEDFFCFLKKQTPWVWGKKIQLLRRKKFFFVRNK